MKKIKLFAFAVLASASLVSAAAEITLDINGAFKGAPVPTGWAQNKPNSWDKDGKFTIKAVPEIEKTALGFESKSKKMHLYTRKSVKVAKGDTLVIKCMAKGKGNGFIGLYNYPAGTLDAKGFKVSEDWQEISKKFVITSTRTKEVRIVFGLQAGGNVEYMDLKAVHTTSAKK